MCQVCCSFGHDLLYCSFHISLSNAFGELFIHHFLFLAETFMMCVNVFYVVRNKISVGSDKKLEIFQYSPIVKITHFGNVMSIDMTLPKLAIFTMEFSGEILCILSDSAEILFLTT